MSDDRSQHEVTMSSSRPYMVRAMHAWITDNGLTPYIVVDATQPLVSVPAAHVHAGKITLNCSYDAVAGLSIENDWIQFSARFSGVSETISFPPTAVQAIYASENGQGVVFPQEESAPPPTAADEPDAPASVRTSDRAQEGRRKPSLKIVK